jgi:hypothetical protein
VFRSRFWILGTWHLLEPAALGGSSGTPTKGAGQAGARYKGEERIGDYEYDYEDMETG